MMQPGWYDGRSGGELLLGSKSGKGLGMLTSEDTWYESIEEQYWKRDSVQNCYYSGRREKSSGSDRKIGIERQKSRVTSKCSKEGRGADHLGDP